MKKRTFYTEAAYVLGLILLAIGTTFMTKSDFGVSTVVAPAYVLHLKVSTYLPFYTFGTSGYTLQAVLLCVLLCILRTFKWSYLFSFFTSVLYGFLLDATIALLSFIPASTVPARLICYTVGLVVSAAGVALLFRTYISPEVYDLFVREVSAKFSFPLPRVKMIYDCTSCVVAVTLSFLCFGLGQFKGIQWGTVVCALTNGWLIGQFTRFYNRFWQFGDGLPLRKYFS